MNFSFQKRNFKAVVFLLCFLIAACPASLGMANSVVKKTLDTLSKRYENLNTLKASYVRVAFTPGSEQLFKGSTSQTASGTLYWSRPSKLLLEQKTPEAETLVTNGSVVWWHIPSEKLVYRYTNIDVSTQLKPLLSFLAGLDSLEASFKVEKAKADQSMPGKTGLTLTPRKKQDGGTFDKLTVWLDDKSSLSAFRIYSATGETTDFTLTNVSENPKISDALFNFKTPKNAVVIEGDGEK